MNTTAAMTHAPHVEGAGASELASLEQAIEHAAHLLPAQGPITVFIHHNTLHAFEELPFDDGVKKGARIFGCQPYLSEDRYRQELARDRIRVADLSAVLQRDLGKDADVLIAGIVNRYDLRMAMVQHPLQLAPDAELRWFIAETEALDQFRDDTPPNLRERLLAETKRWIMRDVRGHANQGEPRRALPQRRHIEEALSGLFQQFGEASIERWDEKIWEAFSLRALWRVCRSGVHGLRHFTPPLPSPIRHRDLLLEATGEDSDRLVNDVLIRFCAAFLDQGFATWPLPKREEGFLKSFTGLYGRAGSFKEAWMRGLDVELKRIEEQGIEPLVSIQESLQALDVSAHEQETFLSSTFLALRGWAGMIRQMEIREDRAAHAAPPGSLIEYLAVRLILERLALAHVARVNLSFNGQLHALRHALREKLPRHEPMSVDQRAFLVFQLAQVLGWTPSTLNAFTKQEWSALVSEIEAFSGIERRKIFHHAYERKYYTQTLDALQTHSLSYKPPAERPRFQAMFCIDEREESFRRHLEELAPDCETIGAAGFFSVPIYYRGAADANYVPLCPIVIRPQHWVREDAVFTHEELHRRRAKTRRALGAATHQVHVGSRTLAGGVFLTAGLGVLASIPLVARILFPRLTARIRRTAGKFVEPPPLTQLQLERTEPTPAPEDGHLGFTVEEMANMAMRLLQDTGKMSNFARLALIVGHGSQSLNNPHNSAYNCGACGGSCGGPNARSVAQIFNDPRVREILARRGLAIPHDTVFVGAWHNTCNDFVTWFDLDRLPKSHFDEFARARADIERACDRNAHERCRRFISAPLTMTFEAARRHVEGRSEDLAQTRPECGHATNALTIVARRERTRGLYMDRRAFLVSYDPTQDDDEGTIVGRILGAVVPVCAGINLEYYFSYTDSAGYGCGTKLPHNVSSLLGIMDGAASDLRTGLPWQMVEIHEPVRCLFIIETTPVTMLKIMSRNQEIARLCSNGWIHLAVLDPHSSKLHVFRKDHFEEYLPETNELPTVNSSVDWYRGWRDHLGFAVITNPNGEAAKEKR